MPSTWKIIQKTTERKLRKVKAEYTSYTICVSGCLLCFIDLPLEAACQICSLFQHNILKRHQSRTYHLSSQPQVFSLPPLPPLPSLRSNWLKPCCGRRAALWQVCLLSAGFNCFLVACVILVVLLLTLELLIDTKLLQCKFLM